MAYSFLPGKGGSAYTCSVAIFEYKDIHIVLKFHNTLDPYGDQLALGTLMLWDLCVKFVINVQKRHFS